MSKVLKSIDKCLDLFEYFITNLYKIIENIIAFCIFIVPGLAAWSYFILPQSITNTPLYIFIVFANIFSLGGSLFVPLILMYMAYDLVRIKIKRHLNEN